jgi:excisionase family DNA binding protein
VDRLLLSITDFCDLAAIGPTTVKTLIRQGRIRTVKIGDRRLIPAQAARDFVAQLEAEAAAQQLAANGT